MRTIPRRDWHRSSLDGEPVVRVRCPSCRVTALLDHSVWDNGAVSPSLDCPECSFHDHVVLAGWEPSR